MNKGDIVLVPFPFTDLNSDQATSGNCSTYRYSR
jgi:hypothetical protein